MRISKVYFFIDRLILFVLTLLVFTTTSECAFSVMKLVKNETCNKMLDDFFKNSLIILIEKKNHWRLSH